MRKSIASLLVLAGLSGCQGLTGAPTATTGWLFQVGSPSLVHVPMIADQSVAPTGTTHVGTHRTTTVAPVQVQPAVPVVPLPKQGMVPAASPCVQE